MGSRQRKRQKSESIGYGDILAYRCKKRSVGGGTFDASVCVEREEESEKTGKRECAAEITACGGSQTEVVVVQWKRKVVDRREEKGNV